MKVGILTGGGDCPGLNPAIRGFVMKALDYGFAVYGIREGWKGLVNDLVDKEPLTVADVEELIYKGGTVLRSSRTNPYKDPAQLQAVKTTIQKHGFDAIVALGGEDTLGVASKLYKDGINTVGVPKTMDNDLSETDYTFGFDSAVQVNVEALDRLRDTARSHSRVIVLEVMGRHAGWVALHTGVAGGADYILLPEVPLDVEALCAQVQRAYARKGYALVVASEGVELPEEEHKETKVDAFGHVILGERNVGEWVAKEIEKRTGLETRSAVTGHIQRGGAPSAFDRVLASRLGVRAAQCVYERDFGKMVALRGNDIVVAPLEAAVGTLRTVPKALYESLVPLFNK
ncbi:MAG TPA: ATP-dependent 6-phosphofructokinase [Chthonomonas sp.]|uniref:6-phosphofructokinase n=1 Tax=Chthonomonas sp. TaxID=2282153 RepID=UPI002B4B7A66|nr:ATP-dependent 6-phosphofructokinase [Chthonomonas sp.]HLI48286.1 ATP-dependent 6-phosphofructokinase [Chthonomonas sp.]